MTGRDPTLTLESRQGTNDGWCTCDELIDLLNDPRIGGVAFDPCGHPSNLFARKTVIWFPPPLTAKDEGKAYAKGGDAAVLALREAHRLDALARAAACGGFDVIGPMSGLDCSWFAESGGGLTYFNWPFSDGEPWVRKAAEEGGEMLGLGPARMNAAYYESHLYPSMTALFVPRRRITFKGAKTQPPFHCILPYWGDRLEIFIEVLNPFATCLVPR